MKIVNLEIKNFGCIDNNGINIVIDNIVVLIGENNVGKSTILQAYEAFASAGSPLPITSFHQQDESNPVEIIGTFTDITDNDKTQLGEKWVFRDINENEIIKCKWQWNKSNLKGEKYSWNNDDGAWEKGGMGGWNSLITNCTPTPLKINPFDNIEQLEKQIVELLVSAVKQSTKSDQSKIASMLNQVNEIAQSVKQEINDELLQTTSKLERNLDDVFPGHKIDIIPQADKFDIDKLIAAGTHLQIAEHDGAFYPLSSQGSGLQRAFLWSALEALADSGKAKKGKATIKDDDSKILLIEEPESFLHPPAIRSAREALYRIAELANWQVIITTHSPIFIDVSKPHTTIIRVEKTSGATKTLSTDEANFSDNDRERLQMIRNCHPTINEFFFANNIILVEGDTEQAVLSEVKPLSTTILNCHGKANIPMFEKILNHFGVQYTVMHDLDSPKAKRSNNTIKNSAWAINQKICLEARKGINNTIIVNVPDFEGQFFGHLQSGDKPYHAICELNSREHETVRKELTNIANHDLDCLKSRIISSPEQYDNIGKEYCRKHKIKEEGIWDFT